MLQIILTITVPLVLVSLLILVGAINKRTPQPEGTITPECGGCKDITCGHNPAHDKKATKNKEAE